MPVFRNADGTLFRLNNTGDLITVNRTGRGTSADWIQGHNTTTGYNRKNGIVGGHNQSAFDNALSTQGGRVTGRYSDPTMPGVETVTYQVAARDTAGNIIPGQYRAGTFQKTVYDPSVLNDQRVAQMSAQAGQRATFSGNATQATVTVDGYRFQVYRNSTTGEITNAHLTHQ